MGGDGGGDEGLGAGGIQRIEDMVAAALVQAEPLPRRRRVPDAERQREALCMDRRAIAAPSPRDAPVMAMTAP